MLTTASVCVFFLKKNTAFASFVGKEPKGVPTNVAEDVHTAHAKSVQKHEKKEFNVMGDEKFTVSATDIHTEHAKSVQKHEKKEFNVMGDEKFTVAATDVHTEHAKAVQKHEHRKFDGTHDHTGAAAGGGAAAAAPESAE